MALSGTETPRERRSRRRARPKSAEQRPKCCPRDPHIALQPPIRNIWLVGYLFKRARVKNKKLVWYGPTQAGNAAYGPPPQPAAFADRKRVVVSRTGSDGKAAPASIDQGARTGGAPHQELLAGPLPIDYVRMVPSREFVPHHPEHRDEGFSATCSALSHCLLLLCCVARTPRTPHAALALLLLVPRTHRQTPNTTHERRRTTTKRFCVPARAQSRRRRSMGHVKTG